MMSFRYCWTVLKLVEAMSSPFVSVLRSGDGAELLNGVGAGGVQSRGGLCSLQRQSRFLGAEEGCHRAARVRRLRIRAHGKEPDEVVALPPGHLVAGHARRKGVGLEPRFRSYIGSVRRHDGIGGVWEIRLLRR